MDMTDDHSSMIKDFCVSGNERCLQELMSKLKFISKIKPQEKLNTNDLFIREPSWHTSVMRTIKINETRYDTFKFLDETIQNAISLYLLYCNYNDNFHQKLIRILDIALKESKKGLDSLCITYANDRMYISKMETLKEMIDAKRY